VGGDGDGECGRRFWNARAANAGDGVSSTDSMSSFGGGGDGETSVFLKEALVWEDASL
jgi:hypothetical protein